ncbi:DUF763 domain-containing protein [Candidatus Micrarchaeota archaeon]|nr:DUF763 domain-containing protein [Candidatus Micrarchaeota archaeon]
MKTGVADLPLHPGRCPKWLFPKMVLLGKAVTEAICFEHGEKEFLRRVSNPLFFQSLGCVLAFDWHSSGLTTTVCGALKQALKESDCGIRVCGGKGLVSRKTPQEIIDYSYEAGFSLALEKELVMASKLSAKIDSACVQDGFELYHHCFFVSEKGDWTVIQQGMNDANGYARRYHWLGEIDSFVVEPHSGIASKKVSSVLDLTSRKNNSLHKQSVDLVNDGEVLKASFPRPHWFDVRNYKSLEAAREFQPKNFQELVSLKGIGQKTLRGLALASELIYGNELDWTDPAKYSYSFGGKDGIPFPVLQDEMLEAAEFLQDSIKQAKLGDFEKKKALQSLSRVLS